MTEGVCSNCKQVIIKDLEKWLKENKEKYFQCPNCLKMGRIKDLDDI